jgi:phage tail sheath gpL-like
VPKGKEEPMTLTTLSRTAALATMIAAGMPAPVTAQTTAADPHHPGTTLAQAMPPSGMMGQGMMSQGMGRNLLSPACHPVSPP